VRDFFLSKVPGMRGKGMVDRFSIDIEGMRRQMVPHAGWKIAV
jgi:hypothetical protein